MQMDTEVHTCRGCSKSITDGQAYELGTDRWHVACFRCSKCHKQLGVNSNFLVLGTGALVCSDCSYTCKGCGKKIYDMAILTGDYAYCAECFKCKSCKKPIEDLRYARTSKGLFCMSCHRMLLEKKKKYDTLKRERQQQQHRHHDHEHEHEHVHDHDHAHQPRRRNGPAHTRTHSEHTPAPHTPRTPKAPKAVPYHVPSQQTPPVPTVPHLETDLPPPPTVRSETRSPASTFDSKEDSLQISFANLSPAVSNSNSTDSTEAGASPQEQGNQLQHSSSSTSLSSANSVPSVKTNVAAVAKSPRRGTVRSAADATSPRPPLPSNTLELPSLDPGVGGVTPRSRPDSFSKSRPAFSSARHGVIMEEDSKGDESVESLAAVESPDGSEAQKNFTGALSPAGEDGREFKKRKSPFRFGEGGPNGTSPVPAGSASHSRKSSANLGRSLSHVFHRLRKDGTPEIPQSTSTYTMSASAPGTPAVPVMPVQGQGTPTSPQSSSSTSAVHMRTQSEHSTSAYTTPPLNSADGFHSRSRSETVQTAVSPRTLRRNDEQLRLLRERHDQIVEAERELRIMRAEINSLSATKTALVRDIQAQQAEKRALVKEVARLREEAGALGAGSHTPEEEDDRASDKALASPVHVPEAHAQVQTAEMPVLSVNNGVPMAVSGSSQNIQKRPGGFMRRLFGSSNERGAVAVNGSGLAHSISGPLGVRQGDEAILSSSPSQMQGLANNLGSMFHSRNSDTSNGSREGENAAPAAAGNGTAAPVGIYELTLPQRADYENRGVPYVITACMHEVAKRGITFEGVYRVSGSALEIDKLERFFASADLSVGNEEASELQAKTAEALNTDIHAVAGMLKRYLQRIPEPLIPFRCYKQFISVAKIKDDKKPRAMHAFVASLPDTNLRILRLLVDHLMLIAKHNQFTKMTTSSLATVFSPTLSRDNVDDPLKEAENLSLQAQATKYLLQHPDALF